MAETASKTVKQRYQEASYLKVGENFELMGTGFTELNKIQEHRQQVKNISMINHPHQALQVMKVSTDLQPIRFQAKRSLKIWSVLVKREKQEQMQNVNLFALIWMKKQREIPLGQYSKHVCLL